MGLLQTINGNIAKKSKCSAFTMRKTGMKFSSMIVLISQKLSISSNVEISSFWKFLRIQATFQLLSLINNSIDGIFTITYMKNKI